MHVVIMGVCGSGKTTVGSCLAEKIGCSFSDADDFHSDANKTKMRSGQPLTDQDRFPWLMSIHEFMSRKHIEGQTIVVTCSALKWSYRDILKYGGLRDYCKLNTGKSSSTELIHQVPKTFNLDGDQSNETISYTQPVTRHGESVQVATTHDNTFVKQEGTEFRNNRNAGLGPNDDGPKRNGQKNEKSTDKNDVQRVSNGSYHSGQVRAEINRAPDNKDEVQIAETSIESKGKPERMMKVDTSQFSPIFVHLTGSPAVLEERLSNRQGHFMPKSLLQSQLDVLEPLGSDENGFTVDIDKSLEDLVMEIKAKLEDTKH